MLLLLLQLGGFHFIGQVGWLVDQSVILLTLCADVTLWLQDMKSEMHPLAWCSCSMPRLSHSSLCTALGSLGEGLNAKQDQLVPLMHRQFTEDISNSQEPHQTETVYSSNVYSHNQQQGMHPLTGPQLVPLVQAQPVHQQHPPPSDHTELAVQCSSSKILLFKVL